MLIIYVLIIILILLLFYKNLEYFTDSTYEINTVFPKIIDKNKAPYDDELFYCKDDEYIIDPIDIDFRNISKMYSYRPKRIKSTI